MTIPVVGNGGIEHAYSSQKNLTILSQSDTKIGYKQAKGHLNTAIEEVLGKKLPPSCYKKNVNEMILILSKDISITDDVMIKIENLEYLFRQARNEAVKDTHDFSDSVNGSVYRKIKDNKPSDITVKQTIATRYMEKIENSINNGKQSPIESNCNRIPFKQFITFSKVPLNLYPQSAGKISLRRFSCQR